MRDFDLNIPKPVIQAVHKQVQANLGPMDYPAFMELLPKIVSEYAKLKIHEVKYRLTELKDILEFPKNGATLNPRIVAYINGNALDQFGREVKEPDQKP